MVKTYSFLVWLGFFFSLGLTAFTCYIAFSKSSLVQCYDKDLNEIDCSKIFNTGRKVGLVVSSVIGLLFQLCEPISRVMISVKSRLISPLPQTSVSLSGDTSISSRTNRPTRTTLVSTRRARPTIPSRASRTGTACWPANTDCKVELYPVQTRVFSLCQLSLFFLTPICPCLFVFFTGIPSPSQFNDYCCQRYLRCGVSQRSKLSRCGKCECIRGWSWDM